MIRRLALSILLPTLLFAAGCGSDSETASTKESTPFSCTAAQAAAKKKQTTAAADTPAAVNEEINKRGAPTVTVPGAPVDELCIIDDVVGNGTEVAATSQVTVQYAGNSQSSGEKFDSSWDRGQPIQFGLNGVIKGWTDGLVGMKVGGRRTLVIPGDQAYGPAGRPPAIAPNDTLVFTIDLLAVS